MEAVAVEVCILLITRESAKEKIPHLRLTVELCFCERAHEQELEFAWWLIIKSEFFELEDDMHLWPREKFAPPASTWVSSVTLDPVVCSLDVTETASPDTGWSVKSEVDAAREADKA